jgi:ABC-type lipoprotein release transport system permease subunit
MLLTIAWRNIWRNRRRSLITAASIFFALFFALIIRSIQIGTFGKMTSDMIASYVGHIQIHSKGYWNEPSINMVFDRDETLESKILQHGSVKYLVPRLESGALVSVGIKTKSCGVIGIDPESENKMTHLSDRIIKGNYLSANDQGALIGDKLAEWLSLNVNDTIILIGQGYQEVSAAGKYPVRGILHMPNPDLNAQMVYLSLPYAQSFYSAEGRITSLSILLNDEKYIQKVKEYISEISISDIYEVMSWNELLVELEQLIQSKQGSSYIITGILYMIVGFGVFGTVVMMTAERRREFGLLTAVGMKKIRIMISVFLETCLLGAMGVAAGFAFALPLIFWFNRFPVLIEGEMSKTFEDMGFEGVIVFSDNSDFMINQVIVIAVILLIAVTYPIIKIKNLNTINAMKA